MAGKSGGVPSAAGRRSAPSGTGADSDRAKRDGAEEAPQSDDANVLGLFALRTGRDLELDPLALGQGAKTRPARGDVDGFVVHEAIRAVLASDEPVALLV